MAVSIGPNDQRLGPVTTARGAAAPAQQTASFAGATVRTGSSGEVRVSSSAPSNEVRQSRQAAATLLSASTAVSVKSDAISAQEDAVEQIAAKLSEAEEESNPSRRAELEQEAQEILSRAQAQFDSLVEEIPSVNQEAVFSAVIPSTNAEAGADVVTITVAAAPSLSDAGLGSISFEDPDAARSQLNNTLDALRSAQNSLQSTSTAITQTVQTRSTNGAAQDSLRGAAPEQPEQLAARLAETISSLDSISSAVDSLDVESLLSEERGARTRNADAGAQPIPLSPLTVGAADLNDPSRQPEAKLDNATLSRRAVTG